MTSCSSRLISLSFLGSQSSSYSTNGIYLIGSISQNVSFWTFKCSRNLVYYQLYFTTLSSLYIRNKSLLYWSTIREYSLLKCPNISQKVSSMISLIFTLAISFTFLCSTRKASLIPSIFFKNYVLSKAIRFKWPILSERGIDFPC